MPFNVQTPSTYTHLRLIQIAIPKKEDGVPFMWPGTILAFVLGVTQPNETKPCESDAAADDAFVEAVRSSPGPIGCRPGGFERIDKLARLLSAAGSGGCSQFGFHGMFGVFSEPLKSSPGWISKYKYGSTKSSFIFNETCAHAHASPSELLQICEIGFNAGHTALLFLEAASAARVLSFDLGDMPWAKKQAALLSRAYGADRFQAVFGSSDETVPSYSSRLTKKASKCDVAFSDGGKTESLRLADLRNFRRLARPQALLLFDEITTLACVRGEGEREDHCGHAWQGTTYAYHRASREGWLRIDRCAWPRGLEGALHASAHHGASLPTGAPGRLASRATMGSAQDAMSHATISRTRATRGPPRMVTMSNVTIAGAAKSRPSRSGIAFDCL